MDNRLWLVEVSVTRQREGWRMVDRLPSSLIIDAEVAGIAQPTAQAVERYARIVFEDLCPDAQEVTCSATLRDSVVAEPVLTRARVADLAKGLNTGR